MLFLLPWWPLNEKRFNTEIRWDSCNMLYRILLAAMWCVVIKVQIFPCEKKMYELKSNVTKQTQINGFKNLLCKITRKSQYFSIKMLECYVMFVASGSSGWRISQINAMTCVLFGYLFEKHSFNLCFCAYSSPLLSWHSYLNEDQWAPISINRTNEAVWRIDICNLNLFRSWIIEMDAWTTKENWRILQC